MITGVDITKYTHEGKCLRISDLITTGFFKAGKKTFQFFHQIFVCLAFQKFKLELNFQHQSFVFGNFNFPFSLQKKLESPKGRHDKHDYNGDLQC